MYRVTHVVVEKVLLIVCYMLRRLEVLYFSCPATHIITGTFIINVHPFDKITKIVNRIMFSRCCNTS